MRRFLLPFAAAALAVPLCAVPAGAAVIISEYVEGSSNNKAIELYNTGPAAADLSGLVLRIYFNGSANPGASLALAGVLDPRTAWVIAHPSAMFADVADRTWSGLTFNGNDAVVLEAAGAVIDSIGQVGFDPGTEWGSGLASTQDNTLRRKPTVPAGDTDPTDAFDPSHEWVGFPVNSFDGLGAHQVVAIPEPASWVLVLAGIGLLMRVCRRGA